MAREGDARLPLWMRLANLPFLGGIWVYRFTLSPLIGRHCRFVPTCSQFGLEAYREHGPIRGTALTLGRLGRCHPLCKGGYDPVPVRGSPVGSAGTDPDAQPDAGSPRVQDRLDSVDESGSTH